MLNVNLFFSFCFILHFRFTAHLTFIKFLFHLNNKFHTRTVKNQTKDIRPYIIDSQVINFNIYPATYCIKD